MASAGWFCSFLFYPDISKRNNNNSHNNGSNGGDDNIVAITAAPMPIRAVVAAIWMVGSGVVDGERLSLSFLIDTTIKQRGSLLRILPWLWR